LSRSSLRDLEEETLAYFDTIDRMGGMVEAIEKGFPQREIAESSYRFQQAVEQRDKVIVGVNDFVTDDHQAIQLLLHRRFGVRAAAGKTRAAAVTRDNGRVRSALDALKEGPGHFQHDAAAHRSGARVCHSGRNVRRLRAVWGEYEETPII
jgi:methylmalonyl-CoA mutase N-terminal domain/subunit